MWPYLNRVFLQEFNETAAILTYINSTTLSNTDCRGYFDDFRQKYIHAGILCTEQSTNSESSFIDTGSGLISAADNKLIGILIWMNILNTEDPGLFTRLNPHLEWISNTTGIVN